MSEENKEQEKEQEQAVNQEHQENNTVTLDNNTKQGLSKTMIIVISTVISLAIIITIVVFVLLKQANEVAKNIETSLNSYLETAKQDNTSTVEYVPFKCTGSTTITCKSSSVRSSGFSIDLLAQNIELSLTPGVKTTELSFNSDLSMSIDLEFDNNLEGPLKMKMNCTDKAEIDGEKSYIINNISCNNTVENVDNKKDSMIYIRHNEFAEGNFLSLVNKFKDDKYLLADTLENLEYAVSQANTSISSSNLTQSFIDIINIFQDDTNKITLEDVRNTFNEAKVEMESMQEFFTGVDSSLVTLIQSAMSVADNVLNNNHNTINLDMKLKDGHDVEDLFFLGADDPTLYDISITSK